MLASSILSMLLFAIVPFAVARPTDASTPIERMSRSGECRASGNCNGLQSAREMLAKRTGPSQRARRRSIELREADIEMRLRPSERFRRRSATPLEPKYEVIEDDAAPAKRQLPSSLPSKRDGFILDSSHKVCPPELKSCVIGSTGGFECIGVWEDCE